MWPVMLTCLVETEGLIKVTGSHIHCKSDNISEVVQDREIVTIEHYEEVVCGLLNRTIFDNLE